MSHSPIPARNDMPFAILRPRLWLAALLSLTTVWFSTASSAREGRVNPPAPEFPVGLLWLNVARPLTLADLHGRVVILDFWTYGCINCIHVADELRELEEKFGEDLVVIGVHSPKFDNERRLSTLRRIVLRYARTHPIVNDVSLDLMRLYRARAWPTLMVLDTQGSVAGYVTGEGHVALLSRTIRRLLAERDPASPRPSLPMALERDKAARSFLAAPGKVATDGERVAISDTLHHRILVTDTEGKVKQVLGDGVAGLLDGNAAGARFRNPQGVVFVGEHLYVADTGNHVLRKVDLRAGRVTTVAGTGRIGGSILTGEFDAGEVSLRSPWDLAWDGRYLYIAMAGTHQIWRYDAQAQRLLVWAGSGREGIADGPLAKSTFSQPSGLAIADNKLYVADSEASAIRVIDLVSQQVTTPVGTGLFDFGDRDGRLSDALLQHPLGVAVTRTGELVVADTYNHKLKAIDWAAKKIYTLAGSGEPAADERGTPLMNEPGGVAILGDGLLVTDTNNDRVLFHDLARGTTRVWLSDPGIQ